MLAKQLAATIAGLKSSINISSGRRARMHLGSRGKINGSEFRRCAVRRLRPAGSRANTPPSDFRQGARALGRLVKTQDVPEAAGALGRDKWTPGGDDAVYWPGVTHGFSATSSLRMRSERFFFFFFVEIVADNHTANSTHWSRRGLVFCVIFSASSSNERPQNALFRHSLTPRQVRDATRTLSACDVRLHTSSCR